MYYRTTVKVGTLSVPGIPIDDAMTPLKKFVLWRLVAIVGIFLAGFFTANSAITVAWLSAFPQNASRLDSLEVQFWSYTTISASLFVLDLWVLVRTIGQINRWNG